MINTIKQTILPTRIETRLGAKVNQFEPELITYMDGLTTPLSSGQKTKLNTFIKSLKVGLNVNALSDFFDALFIRANETAEAGLRNIVKNAHHAIAVNSPLFTQFEGFTGNGTSSYLDVSFNPAIDGVNFQLNDASYGIYFRAMHRDSIAKYNGCYSTSADGGSNNRVIIGSANASAIAQALNSGLNTSSSMFASGLFALSRLSSAEYISYKNSGKQVVATVSTKLPNQRVYELAYRTAEGAIGTPNTSQIAASFYGKGLTDAQHAIILSVIEAYMDSNGKGVIS